MTVCCTRSLSALKQTRGTLVGLGARAQRIRPQFPRTVPGTQTGCHHRMPPDDGWVPVGFAGAVDPDSGGRLQRVRVPFGSFCGNGRDPHPCALTPDRRNTKRGINQ